MSSSLNTSLTRQLKAEASRQGFQLAGVCPAVTPAGLHHFYRWLEAGYAGEMRYLPERATAYEHPRHVLPGARSILMLAMNYRPSPRRETSAGEGRVSCYAWGGCDYHELIHARLERLARFLRDRRPNSAVRGVVDTAPLLERELGQLAGLGWVGKNTLLLNKRWGSWFFLAALLTDVTLDYDDPYSADHCGTCRACLDACPTGAFPRPYVLDATRCLSYLTIELRAAVPAEQRGELGDWLFGCDVCQEVCPWNHRVTESAEAGFAPRPDQNPVDLRSLFELDDRQFRERFRHTPLWRAKRRGLLRNAALLLGARPSPQAIASLTLGASDTEPLVRHACAWALGQIDHAAAREALHKRLARETDAWVRAEVESALQ
jgi:epoxyqueuosine reductase